jgi:hypothetical protein
MAGDHPRTQRLEKKESYLTVRVTVDGKANGMSRLRVFLAIYDQHVFLPGRNLVGDEMYFTLDIGRPLRLSGCSETADLSFSGP